MCCSSTTGPLNLMARWGYIGLLMVPSRALMANGFSPSQVRLMYFSSSSANSGWVNSSNPAQYFKISQQMLSCLSLNSASAGLFSGGQSLRNCCNLALLAVEMVPQSKFSESSLYEASMTIEVYLEVGNSEMRWSSGQLAMAIPHCPTARLRLFHRMKSAGMSSRKMESTIGKVTHLYSTEMKMLGRPIPTLNAYAPPSGFPKRRQLAFLVSSVKHQQLLEMRIKRAWAAGLPALRSGWNSSANFLQAFFISFRVASREMPKISQGSKPFILSSALCDFSQIPQTITTSAMRAITLTKKALPKTFLLFSVVILRICWV